jgi:hypothetical protein
MENKHKNPHELAKKLQSEVEVILSNVDEKMLYAEFRENEIFDLRNGDKEEVVRHTLDERIMLSRKSPSARTYERIERTTTSAAQKISGARKLFYYLFKPLQY